MSPFLISFQYSTESLGGGLLASSFGSCFSGLLSYFSPYFWGFLRSFAFFWIFFQFLCDLWARCLLELLLLAESELRLLDPLLEAEDLLEERFFVELCLLLCSDFLPWCLCERLCLLLEREDSDSFSSP